ncbi:MAG: tetratricopeptide repeat protein [Myxococcota bacterium]
MRVLVSDLRVLVLGLLGLVLLAGACGSDESALADHFDRGEEYRENEQWEEAIIEYKNVLQIDPNHGGAHFGLSQSFLSSGKTAEGFWELREAVRTDPGNHEAAVQFGQLSVYAGELEEALERANAVIAAEPNNEKAWLVKGQAHEGLEQRDEALAAFEKAVDVKPDDDAVLLVLANFHRRAGDRVRAEPLFRKAADDHPSTRSLLALAGFYSEDKDRDGEAEGAYRRALAVAEDGDIERSYGLLGNYLYARERPDEAIAVFNEGIEKSVDPLPLMYRLARIYLGQGREDDANALIEEATTKVTDDPQPYLTLSSYRGAQGDLAGALEAAENAIRVAPDNENGPLRKAEVLLEMGYRDGDEELTKQARELVDGVLEKEPSNPGGLFVRSKLDLAEVKLDDAIQGLRAAIDVRPDWAEAHFLLGSALRMSGQRAAARTELARALEIDASLFEARRVLADVHADLGEHEYAVEEGRRYLQINPGSNTTRIRVAQGLIHMGRIDEARTEIESIPAEARDEQVEFALGRIHHQMGDYETAHQFLLAAVERRPDHPEILSSLLATEERLGKTDDGIARVLKAVEDNPDSSSLQRLLGVMSLAQGKPEDAIAAFEKAIEIDPSDMTAYRNLADVYARTGRTQQIIETYEKALEQRPDQPRIHHFLGVLHEMGGRTDVAVKHYEKAIQFAPDLAESKNNLAYLYAESGENLDRALDLAQDAKALLPDDPNTADTLGWVLYRRGVPGAAVGYLKEAEAGLESDDPNLGLIRHHLALAYKESGEKENARSAARRAIEAHSEFVEAQKARGVRNMPPPPWLGEAKSMVESL